MIQAELNQLWEQETTRIGLLNRSKQAVRKEALAVGVPLLPRDDGEVSEKVAFDALVAANETVVQAQVALEQAEAALELAKTSFHNTVEEKLGIIGREEAHYAAARDAKQPPEKPSYYIGKGQDPAKVLTGDALKYYQSTLEWLEGEKKDAWFVLSGAQAVSKGFAPQIHSKSMRGIETYAVALEVRVLKYRDANALAELAEVAIGIAKGAVDRYQPMPLLQAGKLVTAASAGVAELFGSNAVKEKAKDLEQVGKLRFCDLWGDDGSSDFSNVGTDTDPLELDLYFETVAELLHCLTDNKGFSKRVDEAITALGTLYWENLRPRREYLSSKLYPKGPKDVYGKDLLHPVINKMLEHEHAFAMRHLPEDRAAADRMIGYLEAHLEYLQAPDGTETVVGAHRVLGRAAEMGYTYPVGTLHNTGYTREHFPNVLVGNWLGFAFCSDRFVKACAETIYWHLMIDGIKGSLAPNMGGGQTADDKRTDVAHFRGGATAKITKAKNWGGADTKQGIHAISGSNLPTLAYLTGREDLRAELQALDKTKDSDKYNRHSARLGLLLWATK